MAFRLEIVTGPSLAGRKTAARPRPAAAKPGPRRGQPEKGRSAGQDLKVEQLIDSGDELEPGADAARLEIDDGKAAFQLLRPGRDGHAVQRRTGADLREADQGQGPLNRQAAGVAGQGGDRLPSAAGRLNRYQLSQARVQHQEPVAGQPRGVRHGQASTDRFIAGHVDHAAPSGLHRPPALSVIGFRQRGRIARLAAGHGHAVQMTAVFRQKGSHKSRLPARDKIERRVDRAKTGKQGVHDTQLRSIRTRRIARLARFEPGELMTLDIPGVMRKTRQVAGVVASRRLEPGGDVRGVAERPDLGPRADQEPSWPDRHAHRSLEGMERHGEFWRAALTTTTLPVVCVERSNEPSSCSSTDGRPSENS